MRILRQFPTTILLGQPQGRRHRTTSVEGFVDTVRLTRTLAIEDAKLAINLASQHHCIKSVLAFGGEPLLYPDVTCSIFEYATEKEIPSRQLITNCFCLVKIILSTCTTIKYTYRASVIYTSMTISLTASYIK